MRETVYKCDHCKKEIGSKKHMSLHFANNEFSGIALPPSEAMVRWYVTERQGGKFIHFCNARCLGSYFSVLYKNAELPPF